MAINAEHEDFPVLLAEALDMLAACEMDIGSAARRLTITSSQLTKFLKMEPRAIAQINERRGQLGLRPLR
jgi:hypothetical protein